MKNEIEAIGKRVFGGKATRIIKGLEASEETVKTMSREDGYLSVEEAALLKLRADLLNLSACETVLGKVVQGDGVVWLTRAADMAGANRVGVTLWQVDGG